MQASIHCFLIDVIWYRIEVIKHSLSGNLRKLIDSEYTHIPDIRNI
jgi:hypothetical protein